MRLRLHLLVVCMLVVSGCVGTLPGETTDRTASNSTDASPDRTAPDDSRAWTRADFPDAFGTAPVIVTPNDPSTVEAAVAGRLAATVRVATDTDPDIVPAASLTDRQRTGAVIVVGQPGDSGVARIVSEAEANATRRGLDRREGSATVTSNPWNRSQPLLFVSGADGAGLWAGVEALEANGTATQTRRYEPVSRTELDRLDATDTVSALTLGQLYTKREYFTDGPEATDGTYLDGARQSRLLFQRVTVYTTEPFDDAELERLRRHGVRIGQESWVPGGDDGSYTAVVPLDELDRLANQSSVLFIASNENVVSLETAPSQPGRSDEEATAMPTQSDNCPGLSIVCY